jgi:hypothetical protein
MDTYVEPPIFSNAVRVMLVRDEVFLEFRVQTAEEADETAVTRLPVVASVVLASALLKPLGRALMHLATELEAAVDRELPDSHEFVVFEGRY